MSVFQFSLIRPIGATLAILLGLGLSSKAGPLLSSSGFLAALIWALLMTLLALPRPAQGGGLAISGSAALAWQFGAGPAGLALALGLSMSYLVDSRVRRSHGLLPRSAFGERGFELLRLLAAAIGGGTILRLADSPATAIGLSSLWVVALALALSRSAWPRTLERAGIEVASWAAGLSLGEILVQHGVSLVLPITLLLGGLALHSYFSKTSREAAVERADVLDDMSRAGERVIADGDRLDLVAEQIRSECRRVLRFEWFELGIPGGRVWHTGPDGRLDAGPAEPGPAPAPLPGIHRRSNWKTIQRSLVADDEEVARLELWCDPRRLRRPPGELLDSLLPQMAASLKRAQLDRKARTDSLTSLPLRHVLDDRLERAFFGSRQGGDGLSVILCDIDHFKRINDTWGHATGDLALVRIAELLETHRREGDLCCRWGGEEFALLLESTEGDKALQIADRLRQVVEETKLEVDGNPIPMTLSAGVASFPELCAQSGQELLSLADAALYEAKHQGRNRCLLYRGPGRYLDAQGTEVLGENLGARVEAPRFFA